MKTSTVLLGLVASAASSTIPHKEIEAQVQEKQPGASIFSGPVDHDGIPPSEEAATAWINEARNVLDTLQKRWGPPLCINKWGKVDGFRVNTGINNLRGVSGGCKVRARQCIRTQCIGGDAAIALCNDNYYDLEVSCGHVADLAWDLAKECVWTEWCDGGPKVPGHDCRTLVAGQIFDGTHNVIIGNCVAVSPSGQPVKV
ncbi:hypothetical protein EsH8_V_000180 [Colletotrichum jinshuiense]